ncbi:MAG: acetolactate synthase small subunit [Candidatus Omnitrophica bacterium]|nr:acetolactate synthase small subunit [Candidatus Omnitrophota bacterium]
MADKKNIHTISLLVANKPGVLVRVSLVFARRGFNIDALSVSPTVNPRYSRMTITAQGDPATLDQIIKQTAKLIDVIHSSEHTDQESIHRELALFKIRSAGANKPIILKLFKKYDANVISSDDKVIIVEQTGTTEQVDEFEFQLKKYGVVEMVRSGKLALVKGVEET